MVSSVVTPSHAPNTNGASELDIDKNFLFMDSLTGYAPIEMA